MYIDFCELILFIKFINKFLRVVGSVGFDVNIEYDMVCIVK